MLVLKKVWKDGTRALLLEPQDLVVRLIAAIPPPGFHLLRYFGVLSSHSKLRSEVVPRSPDDAAQTRTPPAAGDQLELLGEDSAESAERARRKRWAWLLAHVFRADVDTCPHCGGPMRWLEVATTQQAATHLLARLGLLPRPPPAARPVCPAQLEFAFAKRTH